MMTSGISLMHTVCEKSNLMTFVAMKFEHLSTEICFSFVSSGALLSRREVRGRVGDDLDSGSFC